jgi:hypothetical protein
MLYRESNSCRLITGRAVLFAFLLFVLQLRVPLQELGGTFPFNRVLAREVGGRVSLTEFGQDIVSFMLKKAAAPL